MTNKYISRTIFLKFTNNKDEHWNCYPEQLSKTTLAIHFNLVTFCPSVTYFVFAVLFKCSFTIWSVYFKLGWIWWPVFTIWIGIISWNNPFNTHKKVQCMYLCSKLGNISCWKFSLATAPNLKSKNRFVSSIVNFRDASSLCFNARLSASPLIWKSFFRLMQIKLIFRRKVLHLASFWK